ncbi:MAG: hypothetical protein ACI9H6_000008 [Patiriisocius sp.]|jgi:hypothetical protein
MTFLKKCLLATSVLAMATTASAECPVHIIEITKELNSGHVANCSVISKTSYITQAEAERIAHIATAPGATYEGRSFVTTKGPFKGYIIWFTR